MSIWQGMLLGLVQGLSEFLPISSSGHLVLFENIFGISSPGIFFEVMLHLGTLAAVVVYYRKLIWRILRRPLNRYTLYLLLATLPAVLLTLLFGDWIEAAFGGRFLGFAFLLTSLVLFLVSRIPKGQKIMRTMKPTDALFVGCAQGVALLPGVSRSGSTIAGGLFCGLEEEFTAEFSFMMSIPAILGSLVLQIVDIVRGTIDLSIISWPAVTVGMVVAALSGFVAIGSMVKVLKKGKLPWFAIYTGALGVLVLVDQHITHFFF